MNSALLEPEKKEDKPVDEHKILDMLWNLVEKPKKYLKIKVVNVFDNAYRINVWGEYHDPLHKLDKVKITHSYFCRLYSDGLVVK
jgi:hypothetical protein